MPLHIVLAVFYFRNTLQSTLALYATVQWLLALRHFGVLPRPERTVLARSR